jgi:hypothetical protein
MLSSEILKYGTKFGMHVMKSQCRPGSGRFIGTCETCSPRLNSSTVVQDTGIYLVHGECSEHASHSGTKLNKLDPPFNSISGYVNVGNC